jgi:hypothetical protein
MSPSVVQEDGVPKRALAAGFGVLVSCAEYAFAAGQQYVGHALGRLVPEVFSKQEIAAKRLEDLDRQKVAALVGKLREWGEIAVPGTNA